MLIDPYVANEGIIEALVRAGHAEMADDGGFVDEYGVRRYSGQVLVPTERGLELLRVFFGEDYRPDHAPTHECETVDIVS